MLAIRSPQYRFGTGAVLLDSNREMIADGWSHRSSFRLTEYESIHAEIHALWRWRRSHKITPHACVIATVSKKSDNTTTALPCIACAVAMYAVGVQLIHYTESGGHWLTEHLDVMLDRGTLKDYRRTA